MTPLKNWNHSVALLVTKLRRYYPFIPQIYSCVRQVLNVSIQTLDSSIPGEIWENQYFQNFSNKWKIPQKPYWKFIEIIFRIAKFHGRLFFNWLFVQFSSKKNYGLRIFAIAYETEILHDEEVKIRPSILL